MGSAAQANPVVPNARVDDRFHVFTGEEYTHQFGTSTTEAAEAIPSEVFADLLLEAAYAPTNLRGAVAATTVDLTARAGDTVSVLAMPTRSASTVSEGTAVSDSSDDPTETTISLTKWGSMNVVTRETLEDSAVIDRNAYAANIMAALADQVGSRIATKLVDATPGSSEDLNTGGNLSDIYERIVDLKQALKANNMSPDTLLVHPDITAQFLKDEREGIVGGQIQVADGEVGSVAGLNVIESSHFNALNTTSGDEMATVIDSSRALGDAWGRRPELIVDEMTNADTDEVRLIGWMRYETEVIDTTAVGHVQNP